MRFSNVFLGLAGVGVVASLALAGCGSSPASTGGAGGTGAGGGSTTTTGSMSTTSSGNPCAPSAACGAADDSCIGLVDNSKLTKFGLRMNQLDVTAPPKLATGSVQTIIAGDVEPNLAACNLGGTADFSWLLQFDTTAMTLKTGGAEPVTDETMGYSFVSTMIGSNTVAPVTFPNVTIGSDGSFTTMPLASKLYVPIYLSATDLTDVVVLPILNPAISMGKLSANQNCIGSYNLSQLTPAMNCMPGGTVEPFVDGGSLTGLITIADADTVDITLLAETLCVLLTGQSDMGKPTAHCPMPLPMTGNACSTAGGTCTDAYSLSANFEASSIKINN
jgi:hypothetical protein